MNLKETLNNINANIEVTESLIAKYEDKRDKIKSGEVKPISIYLCSSLGCVLAMFNVNEPSFDLIMLAGLGGGVIGSMVPYLMKKIRIVDMDYQIWVNSSIIDDLNKKREQKIAESVNSSKHKNLHL